RRRLHRGCGRHGVRHEQLVRLRRQQLHADSVGGSQRRGRGSGRRAGSKRHAGGARVIDVVVRTWSAWAPGIETPEAWKTWAAAPAPLRADGVPDARDIPAMLRRRCTPLSRAMLTAACGAAPGDDAASVRTVFASRYGSINESVP